jgi:hypothetical protein
MASAVLLIALFIKASGKGIMKRPMPMKTCLFKSAFMISTPYNAVL